MAALRATPQATDPRCTAARGRPRPDRHTQPRLRRQLTPTDSVIIFYYNNRFALFTPSEYTEILLTLSAEAGKKILEKIRRLRRDLEQEMKLVRAP
jgi:hypothetical protein